MTLTGTPLSFATERGLISALFLVEPDEAKIPLGLPLPPKPSTYQVVMTQSICEPFLKKIREEGYLLRVEGYCHINTVTGTGMIFAYEVAAVLGAETILP